MEEEDDYEPMRKSKVLINTRNESKHMSKDNRVTSDLASMRS